MEEINVNPDTRIDWAALSRNPKAIKILKANHDKIHWGILSFNTNRSAFNSLATDSASNISGACSYMPSNSNNDNSY
jgi:hypothetical protein